MIFRSNWIPALATAAALAACHSVHTQEPEVSSDPAALAGAADAPSPTPAPAPGPAPEPTPSPTAAPTPAARKLSYNSVEGVGKVVAMTFDDGPHPKLTPKLLDILKERGIKATFFLVGQNAAEYPDIVRRMKAEGHEVANHSWSHPSLTSLGIAGARSQIERTNAAIEKAIGERPTLLRPPYGATSARLNKYFADEFGMTVIMWSVDPLDWKYRNSDRVQREILAGAAPGAIILSHDIHATTVAAMPATLDALIARGYKFATVSELIAMGQQVGAATPAPAAPAPDPTPESDPFEVQRFDLNSTPESLPTPQVPVIGQ